MKVVVSSGFNNFHMTGAAAEAEARGTLAAMICGAYPVGVTGRIVDALGFWSRRKAAKFAGRRVAVADGHVHAQPICEAMFAAFKASEHRAGPALHCYAAGAAKVLKGAKEASVYHYRAGFGGKSIDTAKALGMRTACDHSIVHPHLLDYMVANRGRFPEAPIAPELSTLWRHVLADMAAADHVVVNSDLVAESCRFMGMPAEKLSTVYLGVDDVFLDRLDALPPRRESATRRMLFAGLFGLRKGADTLLEALRTLPPSGWQLRIAGTVAPELQAALAEASADLPVEWLGSLSRDELAVEMTQSDIFVFPTLAEGSARVIFEALAAGCFIVTTANAGSIVEDNVHGRLVTPGDPEQLGQGLGETIARADLAEIGAANAKLIRTRYRQRDYGAALGRVYRNLIAKAG